MIVNISVFFTFPSKWRVKFFHVISATKVLEEKKFFCTIRRCATSHSLPVKNVIPILNPRALSKFTYLVGVNAFAKFAAKNLDVFPVSKAI